LPEKWGVPVKVEARQCSAAQGRGQATRPTIELSADQLTRWAGKLLERLILNRSEPQIEAAGALSNLQFGFRRHRSTTDAIGKVLAIARAAGRGAVQNRRLCAVVTLDVKNAFNTVPWKFIDAALWRATVPTYLISTLRFDMAERELLFGDSNDLVRLSLSVTCGVQQGLVLRPTLWNLFYDGILRLPIHKDTKLVSFADDMAIVIVAHNAEIVERLVNPILADIVKWMTENGLTLVPEKSECIVLTKKYIYSIPQLHVQGLPVPVKRSIRYLGVQLDIRLSFVEHATSVAAGVKIATVELGRLMPNVGGPSQCKRSLLMSVVHSRLLYGAQVWADCMQGVRRS